MIRTLAIRMFLFALNIRSLWVVIIFWIWKVLFLGIKDAVYIFTKILVPHKTYLRGMGIRNTIFIDDQTVLAQGPERCAAHTQIVFNF